MTPEILRKALADLQASGRGNGAVSVRRHFGTLGHSSLQMTQRYAHLADDFLKAEVARMTDQLFKSKP